MRLKLIRVIVALLLTITTSNAALFGNDDRLNKVEQELHQSREDAGGWMIVAGILGIGCTILFGVGLAVGSKARKEVKRDE